MPTPTVTKTRKRRPGRFQRVQPVFVVVRHTRTSDRRVAVLDDRDGGDELAALRFAESVAEAAARDYGVGAASVFRGTLAVKGPALRPQRKDKP